MEQKLYFIDLFDCYGVLLTDKQREYFMDYYFHDLSLSEISENHVVSRNAVSKQLGEIVHKLEEYEKKLHLFEKKEKFHGIIDKVEDKKIKELLESLF